MINSKQRLQPAIVIIIVMFVIGLGVWRYYWVKSPRPIEVFRSQELEAVQDFDALNAGTLSELPVPPEGMKLIRQGTSGILSPTNVHGRILILRYSVIDDADAAVDDILNLYKNYLIGKRWQQKDEIQMVNYYSLTYSHGTACIKLLALYGAPREFEINIWHDFLSQKFSPALPAPELLYNWDMGKTDIVTCP